MYKNDKKTVGQFVSVIVSKHILIFMKICLFYSQEIYVIHKTVEHIVRKTWRGWTPAK